MRFWTPHAAPPRHHPSVVLLEETDPMLRADAHLELGLRAMDRADRATARAHFEEAATLAPDDERARAQLRSLGAAKQPRRRRISLRFWR